MQLDLSLDAIRPGRFQPRRHFDEEKMLGLAQSIRDQGLINPIIVFLDENNRPELLAGERRWRASCALALENRGELNMDLPTAVSIVCRPDWLDCIADYVFLRGCTIRAEQVEGIYADDDGLDGEDLEQLHHVAVVDNIQREDLSPVEVGQALARLKEQYGYSVRKLADVVGQSKSWVDDHLKLTDLTDGVANMVGNNGAGPALDFTLARELARKIPDHLQKPIAEHLAQQAARGANAKDLKKQIADIARFIDPNRWSLTHDPKIPHPPQVYNRARLIQVLLQITPSDQLAQGLIACLGSVSGWEPNYLAKKVSTILDSNWDFAKVVQMLSGVRDPWAETAQAENWLCDQCQLQNLAGGLELRDSTFDAYAPCGRMATNPEAITCINFIGPDDPQVIPVRTTITQFLNKTNGKDLLKSPLQGGSPNHYVTSWTDYHSLYVAARQAKERQAERQEQAEATAHLEPIRQYWQAQQGTLIPELRNLDLDHFQAHACKKCKHFTAQGLGHENAAPCYFAEHPIKEHYYHRAPKFGLLRDEKDGVTIPRCEKFQYRDLPPIKPIEGFIVADRQLVLDWFDLIASRSGYYGYDKYVWGVLAWLSEPDLQKLWDQLDDDGMMMEILQSGVQESIVMNAWSKEKVHLIDPTSHKNTAWVVLDWPRKETL